MSARSAAGVARAIREANAILPGRESEERPDPRWRAVIGVGRFVKSEPEAVWRFVRKWGAHRDQDLRSAIATCVLEHLLEHHFDAFFPRMSRLARAEPRFARTVACCWKFGQSMRPDRAARLDRLAGR